ncbi:MAG: hypothetical protein M1814_003905 [Vezdaea aestivalis]|nr:MAG: hypothetical protein M1814_003905 [Vezdaea aestivalis]
MASSDYQQYVNSTHDFYELLGITPAASASALKTAYRKTTLKYHPDKAGNDKDAADKFQLVQIADALLSDPAAKAAYDNARAARVQKQLQYEQYDAKRREMIERLEKGEAEGLKRKRAEAGLPEESDYGREISRMEAEGRKRREELNRKWLEKQEASERSRKQAEAPRQATNPKIKASDEVDHRSVTVRWSRRDETQLVVTTDLEQHFATFGPIQKATVIKSSKSKRGTGLVVFESRMAARSAVEGYREKNGGIWNRIRIVELCSNDQAASETEGQHAAQTSDAGEDDVFAMLRESSRKKREREQEREREAATNKEAPDTALTLEVDEDETFAILRDASRRKREAAATTTVPGVEALKIAEGQERSNGA